MVLDKQGSFDVSGTFTPEHSGPVLKDEASSSVPARYSGPIAGDSMSLKVALEKESVGTFTLTRDSHPILRKCR
jgi:hypothetical protein